MRSYVSFSFSLVFDVWGTTKYPKNQLKTIWKQTNKEYQNKQKTYNYQQNLTKQPQKPNQNTKTRTF